MFEIEVLSFVDVKVADDYEHYSTEKKEQASLDELISVANSIREVSRNVILLIQSLKNICDVSGSSKIQTLWLII